MRYTILIEKRAEKFIGKLPGPDKERVIHAIYKLPFEGDVKQLSGSKNKGYHRLRVGMYRIIFTLFVRNPATAEPLKSLVFC